MNKFGSAENNVPSATGKDERKKKFWHLLSLEDQYVEDDVAVAIFARLAPELAAAISSSLLRKSYVYPIPIFTWGGYPVVSYSI